MSDIGLFTVDDSNVVRLSLRNITRQVDGPEEALQLVAWAFFTDPGSCFYARADGGGALKTFLGGNTPNQSQLRADAAICLRSTMETVKRSQQRRTRPANATVAGLDLIDITTDGEGTIFVKVRIRLLSGNSFAITLTGGTTP